MKEFTFFLIIILCTFLFVFFHNKVNSKEITYKKSLNKQKPVEEEFYNEEINEELFTEEKISFIEGDNIDELQDLLSLEEPGANRNMNYNETAVPNEEAPVKNEGKSIEEQIDEVFSEESEIIKTEAEIEREIILKEINDAKRGLKSLNKPAIEDFVKVDEEIPLFLNDSTGDN